ncbi:hypothetical protein RJ641_006396, partial [Dillenia turbinata]
NAVTLSHSVCSCRLTPPRSGHYIIALPKRKTQSESKKKDQRKSFRFGTEMADETEKVNGRVLDVEDENGGEEEVPIFRKTQLKQQLTLYALLRRFLESVFYPDPNSNYASIPLPRRIKHSALENGPMLREAFANTGFILLRWTRRGSPIRALLVVSVGMITLLTLTGLLVFMLFFVAATVNAIVISLLMSLAAAGGFLALFFACMTAIYIGALSIAVFVISTATISAIVACLIVTGWIGFFWTVWLAMKKSASLASHSLSVTGSALSAYSLARHVNRFHGPNKVSD